MKSERLKTVLMVLRNITILSFIWISLLFCSKKTGQAPPFETKPQSIAVASTAMPEASGLADSKSNPGYIWVEQDSGNPTDLFLLKHDGSKVKKVTLQNCTNRDWEDIVLSTGPDAGKNYLYIAETGDNLQQQPEYAYYRLEEPAEGIATVSSVDKIPFTYPDGSHDAEAFLVDPVSKDIFIITKRDSLSRVYKLGYPYSTTDVNTPAFITQLSFNQVTAAALSPDRKEILVKNYTSLYYYTIAGSESLGAALAKPPQSVPYTLEPQGEAITFANDNSGFFTFSEKFGSLPQTLYFYKRK